LADSEERALDVVFTPIKLLDPDPEIATQQNVFFTWNSLFAFSCIFNILAESFTREHFFIQMMEFKVFKNRLDQQLSELDHVASSV
jgi:hypothetical protein